MNEIDTEQKRKYVRHLKKWGLVLAILYVGGWAIMWRGYDAYHWANIYQAMSGRGSVPTSAVLLDGSAFGVRINSAYYGVQIIPRFFDAPFLSWLAFGGAVYVSGLLRKLTWRREPEAVE